MVIATECGFLNTEQIQDTETTSSLAYLLANMDQKLTVCHFNKN